MTSLAQGAAGVALVVALALLGVRERGGAMVLLAVQAVAVAVSAAARNQFAAAVTTLLLQAAAMPAVLRRVSSRLDGNDSTLPTTATRSTLVVGAILALPQGTLGLPLAVTILGLLVTTRRHPVSQLTGLTAMQNGLILAAIATSWVGPYVVVVPVVPALAAAALWHATRPHAAVS
jgi:hypothetical protein